MVEPLNLEANLRLSRALAAGLQPATGTRGTGTVTVTAVAGGADKVLQPNTYLLPVVGGKLRTELPYKVDRNPATVAANGTGGAWTVAPGATAIVAIKSNVGGAQHNQTAGTVFRFDPPLEDFEATATLDTNITDADDTDQLIKRVHFFEDLDGAGPNKDIFAAMLGQFPSAMIVWEGSAPAEGLTAGMRQGSTRVRRQGRVMRETFGIYIVAGRLETDHRRRRVGMLAVESATRLLTDRQCNDDGEGLSSIGAGVEIVSRQRFARSPKHYIYGITLRCNQTLQPIDSRTYSTWIATRIHGSLPGREAPEPTDELEIVDVTQSMT